MVFTKHETANANAPVDWNCDLDATDSGLTTDINRDDQKSLLTTQNDWAIVNFSGNGVIGRSALRALSLFQRDKLLPSVTYYTDELTAESDRKLHKNKN